MATPTTTIVTVITGKLVEYFVEKTGTWGYRRMLVLFKKPILKRIESQMMIDIPSDGHNVQNGRVGHNIVFNLILIRPYPATLKITRISYGVIYKGAVIQRETLNTIIVLDRNNIKRNVQLIYYPMESPIGFPNSPSGFEIKGIATIETIYGTFDKSFESNALNITSSVPWNTIKLGVVN